jgi:D-alanine transaminase
MQQMSRFVYVDGAFVPFEEARISIMDRGFLFADGIYEVSAVLGGRLVDNAAHLARLERSLTAIRIPLPVSLDDIVPLQEKIIALNALEEGIVYIQVTRGVAERDFAFPKDGRPTMVMFTQPKNIVANPRAETGVPVITVPDIRWERCDIKSVALLAQVLAKQEAAEKGAYEALMIADGKLTEGGSSSIFVVDRRGRLITRPLSNAILPGITRATLLRLAAEHQITIEEREVTVEEIHDAAEIFLTSASSFVLPISSVDGRPVGDGKPGPVTRKARAIYLEMAQAV